MKKEGLVRALISVVITSMVIVSVVSFTIYHKVNGDVIIFYLRELFCQLQENLQYQTMILLWHAAFLVHWPLPNILWDILGLACSKSNPAGIKPKNEFRPSSNSISLAKVAGAHRGRIAIIRGKIRRIFSPQFSFPFSKPKLSVSKQISSQRTLSLE